MSQMTIPITAGADLQAYQYRAVAIGGTLATGTNARGILQGKPDSGEDATLLYAGRSKFVAGAGLSNGDLLAVASGGFMVAVASGDTSVGYVEGGDVSSGAVGHGVFNFTNAAQFA